MAVLLVGLKCVTLKTNIIMNVTITLDEKSVDIVIDALTMKMGRINSASIISGVVTEKMRKDYSVCEKVLDLFNQAKDCYGKRK
jgi:hypothetical protein